MYTHIPYAMHVHVSVDVGYMRLDWYARQMGAGNGYPQMLGWTNEMGISAEGVVMLWRGKGMSMGF